MKQLVWILLSASFVSDAIDHGEWTWSTRKIFSSHELQEHKQVKMFMNAKESCPRFNQLLFSWNAFRQTPGSFSFYVQVRFAHSKKWSKWFKMMQWGKNVQHSFASDEKNGINYLHVRLELGRKYADAFRIKVASNDGADLSLVKSFVVCTSDLNSFESEENRLYDLPSIHIKGVPEFSQFALDHPRNGGLCSPTSCSMLCSYLLGRTIDSLAFAEQSYDYGLEAYGSWPFNTAHAFELCEGKFWFSVARLHSFAQLYALLMKEIPVIVSVQGPLIGSATPYASGHLLVVTGYDNDTKEVICNDPAFQYPEPVVKRYPLKDFLTAWERRKRLAYLAEVILPA